MRYIQLVELYGELSETTKRLEKTFLISQFLKTLKKSDNISAIIQLLQGRAFPPADERKIGMSSQLVMKALVRASGYSSEDIEKEWSKIGDLGEVSAKVLERKKQTSLFSQSLDLEKVYENLRSLALLEGKGTVDKKLGLLAELYTSASPEEAKYITRTVLEDMRIGVAEGTLRDAIVWAYFVDVSYDAKTQSIEMNQEERAKYNQVAERVQRAYDLATDFSLIIKNIVEHGPESVDDVSLALGQPFNVMLAIKVQNPEEAINALGTPLLCEYKLDGFRAQIHKKGKNVKIFTRRLEEVTPQFQELVPSIIEQVQAKEVILDGEIMGYDPKTKKYKPFQEISQRIKRKYDLEEMAKKLPVEYHVFDILYKDGKSLMHLNQLERRSLLEEVVRELPFKIVLTKKKLCSNVKEIEEFYQEALSVGHEGIILKNIEKEYTSGRKVGGWLKLKPILEPLDLVIVGAERGTGKRAGFLSSFVLALRDKDTFLECGMVGTGIKEKEESEGVSFSELTKLLTPLIIEEKGKQVKIKPKIIVEVNYEEIQKSPTYSSGYALRFPRVLRLRHIEKGLKDINTLQDVERIYKEQKQRGK